MEGGEGISHWTVEVNGISMHVGEKGDGPVVILLHGFPELWYSWRHQIVGLAARGYHAVAPDLRGYGDTTSPPSVESYTVFHIVGDIIALIDALGQEQVFVVGHDWGALIAWYLSLFRPERVKGLVNLSVAFMPRNPDVNIVDYFRSIYGDDYYICRFQVLISHIPYWVGIHRHYVFFDDGSSNSCQNKEVGAIEEEYFGRYDPASIMKTVLTARDPGPPLIFKENSLFSLPDAQTDLPSWLSEGDINYFATKFKKTGFTGGINYYRCFNLNWELLAPWTGAQIKVPTKYIVGDLDLTYHYPGIQDYIHKGGFKKDVPLLEDVVVMVGVGHFINQEKAHEITEHIYDFIQKF